MPATGIYNVGLDGVNLFKGGVLFGTETVNIDSSAAGTDGQVLIGASGGGDPKFASLTSFDGTVTYTAGPNTLDLSAAAAVGPTVPTEFDTDSGNAIPAAHILRIVGGTGISTSGAGNTVTISLSGTVVDKYIGITFGDSPYAVSATDYYVACDVSGGAITVQLPNSTSVGRVFVIKDQNGLAASNNIIVTTVGGVVTLDGATTFTMNTQYESAEFLFDGSKYQVF